jgi:4-aminobutyrate aminotransferase-like enzyme
VVRYKAGTIPIAKALNGVGLPLAAPMYYENLDTTERGAHSGIFRRKVSAMRAEIRTSECIDSHNLLDHAQTV